jgi:hypothetical protein
MTPGISVDDGGDVHRVNANVRFGVTPLCDSGDKRPRTFPRLSSTNEVLSPIHSTYYCY